MKKLLAKGLAICLLVTFVTLPAQGADAAAKGGRSKVASAGTASGFVVGAEMGGDFRNAKWGMTVSEVCASEPDHELESEGNVLYGTIEVAGAEAAVINFGFDDSGRLVAGVYGLRLICTSNQDVYDLYDAVKAKLDESYGKADTVVKEEETGDIVDMPSPSGSELFTGELFIYAKYSADASSITLRSSAYSDGYAVLFVDYQSSDAAAEQPDNQFSGDFRNAKWGMTQDEVRAAEPNLEFTVIDNYFKVTNDKLTDADRVFGDFETNLYFLFDDDGKFYRGAYKFPMKQTCNQDVFDVFDAVKAQLDAQYGTAETVALNPVDATKMKMPDASGMELVDGTEALIATYNTPLFYITLATVYAADGSVATQLEFRQPK
jgi:hypothetical protein